MSDWSFYGTEDVVWDEFVDTYDHIVIHQGGEHVNESVVLGYSHKKPQHEIENNGGKITDSRGIATENVPNKKGATVFCPSSNDRSSSVLESSRSIASRKVVAASCAPGCIVNATALASRDSTLPNSCFKECIKDIESNTFCSANPILGTTDAADHNKGSHFSVPADASFGSLVNEQDRTSDLLYNDWSDVSNFEDNGIFSDSTFVQGSMGTGDEMSFFSSSSHAIYGSEDNLWSTVQSSFSESCALNSTLGNHGASTNMLPGYDLSTFDNEKPSSIGNLSCALVTDGENKGESALQVQAGDGGIAAVIKSALNQIDNDNSFNECEPYSSQTFSKQRHCSGTDSSSYMCSSNPHAQLEQSLDPHQAPLTRTILSATSMPQCMESFPYPLSKSLAVTSEEEMKKLCHGQQLHDAAVAEYPHEQAASLGISTIQKKHHKIQHEIGGDNKREDINLELPAFEIDFSTVHEDSCMKSSIFDDVSLKATSIQQLQNVTNQPYSSQRFLKQRHCWGTDSSSYTCSSNPHAQLEHSLDPHQAPLTQTTSSTSCMPQCMETFPDPLSKSPTVTPEEEMKKLCHMKKFHAALVTEYPHEQAASSSISTIQKKDKIQHEIGGDNKREDISLELPAFEMDFSTVHESSCMKSSISDDLSLKATSIQQLHDVTNQLDVGTKRCIRDSLFRLARGAVQRSTNNGSGESITVRRSEGTEESKKFAELMGVRTVINPLDRSIANLLFYRPSELTTRSADIAM